MQVVVYTYYGAPWRLETGDDVRIHTICKGLKQLGINITIYNLSQFISHYTMLVKDGVVYISTPRKLYMILAKTLKWERHYDLNPLMKLTHYIDELITTVKLRKHFEKADVVIVFGSMTLFSFLLRLLKFRGIVVYDPLSNYAQTLYLRSRRSLVELMRYSLYLALHKLQIRSSDIVVYPSKTDLDNAIRMFKPARTFIVPNPTPVCFHSLKEYVFLQNKRKDYDRAYFMLLAGGRGRGNEEAVRTTIEVFNKFPPEKFRLMITGPWQDMKKLVRNPSIELLGVVPKVKLKELLAISDYGLSPIFGHCAGTFLKMLAYISAGLDIIASPYSIIGIGIPKGINVYLVKNKHELARVVEEIISSNAVHRRINVDRPIVLCRNSFVDPENLVRGIKKLKEIKIN